MIAESSNNTKLIRWLNILETLVENKIELLWRSSKNPELTCADYLSRFTNSNRHENLYCKFSNKLPKLTENQMKDVTVPIPEQYKLNDRLIKYAELIDIFKRQKDTPPEINSQPDSTCTLDSILASLTSNAPSLTQEVYNSKTGITPQKYFLIK